MRAMPSAVPRGISVESRKHLEHEIHHIAHVLPGQGPIETFIHHNTLHGFQHLHFEQAVVEARRVLGGRGYLPLDEYRRLYAIGRITDEDLERARHERNGATEPEPLLRIGNRTVTTRDVERLALLHGLDPLEPGEGAEPRFGPKVFSVLRPELSADARGHLLAAAKREFEAALARVGRDFTVADLLADLLATPVPAAVLEEACLDGSTDESADPDAIPRALETLGIPEDARAGYLDLVRDKLASGPAKNRPERWLEAEVRKVRRVLLAHFGVEGTLPAIAERMRRDPEGLAVLSLLRASLASFGLSDPFSPIHAENLTPEEPVGARIEALFERIEHLEAWGGPAIPLDAELAARVRDTVRAHLEERDGALGPHAGAATSEIARLCLTVVHDLGPDHLRRRGFEALRALESAFGGPPSSESLIAELTTRDPRRQMMEHAARRWEEHIGKVGPETCHRDLLLALTGEDIHEKIHPQIMRVTMAFLDEGLAAWHVAGRSLGFYDAFRKMAEHDRFFELEDLPGARDALRELPPLAVDAILQSLERLGVPELHWGPYLRRICVGLPGLAGMVHWRETHPDYPAQRAHPIDLLQFLAVRLFYEVLFVRRASLRAFGHDGDVDAFRHYFSNHLPELLVRHALFLGELPDFLAERARALFEARSAGAAASDEGALLRLADMVFDLKQSAEHVNGGHSARHHAFRLFLLAQHLGISPGELRATSLEGATRLLAALDACDPDTLTPLWQCAYEIHYRDGVLEALTKNVRDHKPYAGRREAQIVFCMDDREESIRRHIEEMRPSYETFGVAGFFGVAIAYEALGAREAVPLCPIVATPAAQLCEVPRPEAMHAWASRSLRTRALAALRDVIREVTRNPVSSYFVIDILGFFSLFPVLGRLLFPRAFDRMSRRAKDAVLPAVETEVPLDREREKGSAPKQGSLQKTHFTLTEQADRVAALLRNIGLVRDFAPVVMLSGHGSESRNNPHLSAYDCGACGGKHGGPNARVFARMANDSEVRALVRERGIDIPDDTWFLGTEHNTATDEILYFDLGDVPHDVRPAVEKLRGVLQRARERSAHERCRKFESAPKNPTPARALRHVVGRTADLSQARPELGHATIAFAVIGPRSISQGVFLDRRSFLISYDPSIDPEGTILEGTLLAAGPVGAGINLEYYFSTVDNTTYGCGTKVPHNVAGLIGVMEGASGDLRTGLPRQMIEIHEPMRLQMLVVAKTEILGKIYEKQPAIRELVGNAWVHLIAMDPETGVCMSFQPGKGFIPWEPQDLPVKTVKASAAWYSGTLDFLPPAFIRPDEPPARGQAAHA
ncbi:putative inorganic carbon transporter subunit DabA [Polyangium sorediatum]|uniref:Probable inorganic carbon transporter subunit DabA n=1 Tax=Polyangium sorediatum TaxID=889274 RepID=A0ABT6NSN0_9BACT|nr:putative inorganic carbon transporter subunit DabA [Polyangium sorediatum]MDI1431340.1 Na-translocating system protein MpsB [Polyangium sorediatum]